MKIYHSIDLFGPVPNPVVSVGTFDGVHLGHQQIFAAMKEEALRCGGETVVVTFYPHPRLVIHPDSKDPKFINTQEKKYEIINRSEIDHLIIIPFTREFSNISSAEFVKRFLVEKINVHKLIVGYDHHFGKDRHGSFTELKGLARIFGFELQEVQATMIDGLPISSTKIRKALIEGNVKLANSLLGYDYSISGKVVYGNRIGRTIGFPTANIELEDHHKLVPGNGVYVVEIKLDKRTLKGMMNIGMRPTVGGTKRVIEVHIFDFDEDIYHKTIRITLIKWLRPEQKFNGLDELKVQLAKDEVLARKCD